MPINNTPKRNFSVAVHWKNRKEYKDEEFFIIEHFFIKYPSYNQELIKSCIKNINDSYEDGSVKITKVKIKYTPGPRVKDPVFPPSLFWEFNYNELNWRKGSRSVIQRITEKGTTKEWEELIRYYGKEKIINALRNEVTFLPDVIIEEVCDYYNLKKEDMLCYIRKQSLPKHWI